MFKQSVPLGSTTETKRKPHESLSTVCTVRFHNWKKQKLHCAHLGEVIRRDFSTSLPPANEVCEGYVFTPVCHSVHRGGGVHGQVHLSPAPPLPPGQVHPPGAVHAGRYGQQAGGTHPTGMLSCCLMP